MKRTFAAIIALFTLVLPAIAAASTWNAALETGGVVVGDEVAILLEIEMIRK